MKVSKKSLIASIAVLCVCALSLTAASFAWFSASKNAQVNNIQLKVDAQSELEISVDNGVNWGYTFACPFDEQAAVDLSTADLETFYVPSDRADLTEAGKVKDGGTYTANSAGLVTMTVYFRTKAENMAVKMGGAAFSQQNITSAMRIGALTSDGAFFFSNSGAAYNAISATSGDTTSVTPNVLSGNADVEIVDVLDAATIDGIGSAVDGYYYGKAVVTFWVEGTDDNAINANAGVKFNPTTVYFEGVTG